MDNKTVGNEKETIGENKTACIFNKFKIIMLFIIKYGNDTWLKA